MTEVIRLDVRLQGYVRRQGRKWVAVCPSINVVSQGSDQADAQRCLQEAAELWFDSCVERGTLEQALRECGFRPTAWGAPAENQVQVTRAASQMDVLGNAFDLQVSVPAYQAATFLGYEGSSADS